MKHLFKTAGTCSSAIEVEVDENGIIKSVQFVGGCSGNLSGIASLAEGESIDKLIEKLKGIKCGGKATSCPDQLSLALEQIKTITAKS